MIPWTAFFMLADMATEPIEKPPTEDEATEELHPIVNRLLDAAISLNKAVDLGKATPELYAAVASDQPIKFTAEQAGFKRQDGRQPRRCSGCWHHFMPSGEVRLGEQHGGACEIVRAPKDEHFPGIRPSDICEWYTEDGINFPLRDGEATDTAAESEGEPKSADSED